MTEIGGAMGPLYGTFFLEMAGVRRRGAHRRGHVGNAGGGSRGRPGPGRGPGGRQDPDRHARPGEEAYRRLDAGDPFAEALAAMAEAAEPGKESTRDLVAKIGRASRLGERSRGILDAGATSCWLLLRALADSMQALLVRAD